MTAFSSELQACRAGALSILIVENNPLLGGCLRRYLESRGHTVLLAGTVLEARSELLEHHFDVLLSDVYLEGETCFPLLRSEATLPRLVITMSAFDLAPEELGPTAGPWQPHLTKPFSTDVLDALLAEHAARFPPEGDSDPLLQAE